ncbi:MAG: ABC transporter permease [Mycobacteriales bacterium]
MSVGVDLGGAVTRPADLIRRVWERRQLVLLLARKEFFVRYRRASFGVLWAVLLPALQAVVLTIVGAKVLRIHTHGSYPLFVYSGLVGYAYVTTTLATAATAIVDNSALSSKIYFPRAVVVLAGVLSSAYAATVNIALLLILQAAVGGPFGIRTLLLVPAAALAVGLVTGWALLLAGLHVYFRDIRFLVQALLTLLLYVTPVFYPEQSAPTILRGFLVANPVTGVVELFRAATVGTDPGLGIAVTASLLWTLLFAVAALTVHCRQERNFADLL